LGADSKHEAAWRHLLSRGLQDGLEYSLECDRSQATFARFLLEYDVGGLDVRYWESVGGPDA
jgi:hypothetical protein